MKRFLAMVLALCMLFSMQTVFASAEGAEKDAEPNETRTMEEILNEYHQKAAEAQLSAEKNTGASSRSAASGKTLEQETVDTLTAAGYEAYNVTGDNYDDLEETLKTDFGSLGLDPEGSYVIVISGDEEDTQTNSNSRGRPFIEEVAGPGDDTGGAWPTHTYNGKTYTMRYVTVVSTGYDQRYLRSDVDLLAKYGLDDLIEDLDLPITILANITGIPAIGTIYSLIAALVPDYDISTEVMEYEGRTNWTVKYVQVYNSSQNTWKYTASTEYVTMTYSIEHSYFDPVENKGKKELTSDDYGVIYSENYNNTTYVKDRAAQAYENNTKWQDKVSYVEYRFNGEMVIRHNRFNEPTNYEPS